MTNQYFLGPNGEQMTEMLTGSGVESRWLHTNVYAGGNLIATYQNDGSGPHFRLTDWLGTMRVQTDYSGVIEQRCPSLPFGDGPQCHGATEQFFTGKERDSESGLDYFGARYYGSSMGRWMSPDWSAKADPVPYAKLDNPQSLNLYSYVYNNPLSRSDPDGHEVDLTNKDQKLRNETEKRILSNVNKNERGLFNTTTDKNGKTTLNLNKDATANFDGKHSNGYNMLTQAIGAKAVASVEINDHPTSPFDGHSFNTGADAGGGRTFTFSNGNASIFLSTNGDESGVSLRGMQHQIIDNPVGIIAGHELLGHGRLNMLGQPSGEGDAVGVENQLRREQGLPQRLPGYN